MEPAHSGEWLGYPLGSIAGTLVEASSGSPIPFASLTFYDATGDTVGFANSDEMGYYITEGLEEGIYFGATQIFGGYRNEVYDDIPCTGQGSGDCDPLAGTPVAVLFGVTTGGIDFALDRLGAFTGWVVDEA